MDKPFNAASLDELNEVIEREYTDGATDSSSPTSSLWELLEEQIGSGVGIPFDIEFWDTGSVTIEIGSKKFALSLVITQEK